MYEAVIDDIYNRQICTAGPLHILNLAGDPVLYLNILIFRLIRLIQQGQSDIHQIYHPEDDIRNLRCKKSEW